MKEMNEITLSLTLLPDAMESLTLINANVWAPAQNLPFCFRDRPPGSEIRQYLPFVDLARLAKPK
jgi:hypothetical protein